MPVSADIYNAFAPRVQSPQDVQNGLAQGALLQSQLQQNSLASERSRRDFDTENALRQAVMSSGGDPTALRRALVQSGNAAALDKHDQGQALIAKERAAADASGSQAKKHALESAALMTQQLAQGMRGIDPNDNGQVAALYERAHGLGMPLEAINAEVAQIPKAGTQERLDWHAKQVAMGQSLADEMRQKLDEKKQAEQSRQFGVTSAQTASHNKATEGVAYGQLDVARKREAREGLTAGIPSGFENDPSAPAGTRQLRPIAGGPHDPNGGGGQGNRAELMFNRVVSAANEATAALKNISDLPVTASTGFFGTAQAGTSLLGSAKSVLGQKMTSQEAQDTKVMFAGVARALGAIETSGLQVNGSLIHSMESVTLNEGDTQMTKLRKLAEVRQIVEKGLEPNLSNPKIPEVQKEMVRKIISEVAAAVPYTHADITRLQQAKSPTATISDFAKSSGVHKTAPGGVPSDIADILKKHGPK